VRPTPITTGPRCWPRWDASRAGRSWTQPAAPACTCANCSSGEPLPYPDGAFDLIVCALAIHYASNRAAAFAEFCRVLRPGGAAVVSTQHPVMDWLRKGGSYFQTTLETDVWNMPTEEQPVHFWREPLSALCGAATDAGFLIERLIEPVPAETMRQRYPKDYEQLSKEPGFLILRLLKPARPIPVI